ALRQEASHFVSSHNLENVIWKSQSRKMERNQSEYQFDIGDQENSKANDIPQRIHYYVSLPVLAKTAAPPELVVAHPHGTSTTLKLTENSGAWETPQVTYPLRTNKPERFTVKPLSPLSDSAAAPLVKFHWARVESEEWHLFLQTVGISRYPPGANLSDLDS